MRGCYPRCGVVSLVLFIIATLPFSPPARAQVNLSLRAPVLAARSVVTNLIQLDWNDISGAGYLLDRKVGADKWSPIAVLFPGTNSYSDRDVFGGVTYFYRARATNHAGASTYSDDLSVTTPGPSFPAPSGTPLLYADAASHIVVHLRWTDVEAETQFRIERKNEVGQWTEIAAVGGNSTDYFDEGLTHSSYIITASAAGIMADSRNTPTQRPPPPRKSRE